MSVVGCIKLKAAAVAALALLAALPGTLRAEEPASEAFTLDNGLKVFLVENHNLPLLHTVVGVNVGSKNETAETNGLVHVLEHLVLFRGSRSRTAEDIGRDIRKHGGYFNAHTGHDISLFELTLPSAEVDFALRNQEDILFHLRLDQAGLDAERTVILEEMNQMRDDPLRAATALVYQNLFPGHPYSLPITGTPASIARLTLNQVDSFHREYFTPSNCSLAVVGDFVPAEMKKKVEEVFGPLPRTNAPAQRQEVPRPLKADLEITLEMDIAQAYCLIGLAGPDYNHPDQFAVDLLVEILGRGVNPMIGAALRGERKLAESAFMTFQALERGGALLLTLNLDPRNVKSAKREALSFLRTARTLNFSPDDFYGEEKSTAYDYLGSAKNQVIFLSEKSREKGLNLATSLARHLLLSSGAGQGGYLENIGKITTSNLRQAAAKYLSSGRAVVVSVIPIAPERKP